MSILLNEQVRLKEGIKSFFSEFVLNGWSLHYSPVPCGRNQKHIGVFGGSYQNLHTGTVFDAEQGGKSHSAKKWHGLLFSENFFWKNCTDATPLEPMQ